TVRAWGKARMADDWRSLLRGKVWRVRPVVTIWAWTCLRELRVWHFDK
ncbi:hypothetical protein V6N11_059423, partial [Hibiscus sabdariffa]